MLFRIPHNKHRARPLYWLQWWPVFHNPVMIARQVVFPFAARYQFTGDAVKDQADHNKLFGVAFGKVHYLSARFGWRYDPVKDKFILSAYCYLNGTPHMDDLCECRVNERYVCRLLISHTDYIFQVVNDRFNLIADYHITKGHRRKWSVLLGLYFGGNQKAPVPIEIEMKKL
jgi:hypothetical protein